MNKAKHKKSKLGKRVWAHRELYFMLLPAVAIVLVFSYIPMYGILMAFQDVKIGNLVANNEWVGLKHFIRFFTGEWASTIIKNTIITSLLAQFTTWPVSIFLAVLLYNSTSRVLKKVGQTCSYIPHLLSTAIVVSIIVLLCSGETGLINILLNKLGMDKINFFGDPKWVRPIYTLSEIWTSCGYGAIIYLGALNSIDEEILQASLIDGAGKWQRIRYIQLPMITSTIATMLILKMGGIMAIGADKMLLLQTDLNIRASEVISTYVYKTGIGGSQYGFSTAVGLFNGVVTLILVLITNWISKKTTDTSII